jgi:hypothetical protein
VEPSAPSTVPQDDETLNAQGVYVKIRVVAIGGILPDKFDIERPNQVQLLSRHLITREDDIVVENIKPQQVY